MPDILKEPITSKSQQIHTHLPEKTREQLLDELVDYLYETDEYSYDEVKYDAILAEIDKLDPMLEITGAEESLVVFHEKYASLFTSTEKIEP